MEIAILLKATIKSALVSCKGRLHQIFRKIANEMEEKHRTF